MDDGGHAQLVERVCDDLVLVLTGAVEFAPGDDVEGRPQLEVLEDPLGENGRFRRSHAQAPAIGPHLGHDLSDAGIDRVLEDAGVGEVLPVRQHRFPRIVVDRPARSTNESCSGGPM